MQTIEAKLRRNGGAVPDEVAVFFAFGAEAGVEVVFDLLKLHNSNVRIYNRIKAGLETSDLSRFFQIKMSHLPFGVNSGVRATGVANPDLFAGQRLLGRQNTKQRIASFTLNSPIRGRRFGVGVLNPEKGKRVAVHV